MGILRGGGLGLRLESMMGTTANVGLGGSSGFLPADLRLSERSMGDSTRSATGCLLPPALRLSERSMGERLKSATGCFLPPARRLSERSMPVRSEKRFLPDALRLSDLSMLARARSVGAFRRLPRTLSDLSIRVASGNDCLCPPLTR